MELKRVVGAVLVTGGLLFGKGGLDINPKELEQIIAQNPNDVANRLLLAKYYIQQDQLQKAEEYLKQAKQIDPNNRLIKVLEQQLEAERKKLQAIANVLRPIKEQYGSIDNYISDLFMKGKYKQIIDFYLKYGKYLHLSDSSLIKIAKIFDWNGEYRKALWVLKKIKDKTSLDYYTIRADVAYNTQDMKTAIKYYRILFSITGDPLFGKRLAQLYIWNGDLERAQKVLLILKRRLSRGRGKPDKELQKLWEEVQKKKREYIERVKKIYEENPSFANLQRYVYAVADKNLSKGIPIVIEHIKRHPEDGDAKFFLAKLYAWTNQYQKAVEYLRQLKGNKEAELLLAQILSWQGKYPEAERIFEKLAKDSNRSIAYQAEKGLGLIYSWTGRKEEAIKIFEKLHKENPKDKEVNVQLILLKGTPKQLIAYYKSLLRKNPKDGEALLGLGDLYFRLKKYGLAARYYEKYLLLYPNKLEVYKMLGDAYLQLKNFYKGFSNWEYYAYMKGTKEAYLELAKRYYWYGFNNEALKVLDDLLARYPKFKEARLLKAKILKVNPRFVVASSAATFEQYLGNRSKKLLALGDRAYFNGFYSTAAQYYKELLLWEPENYDVREKYAYSLEHIGDYKTAAGEFFLLMWMKKNPQIVYNYAFCLQKAGKLKEAEKIYKELLNEVPRPAPQFIVHFLEKWREAFQSMDSYKLAKFYSPKLAHNPRWRFKKDQFFQKQVWVALSLYDPVLLGVEQKGDKKIYKVRFWEILATKYIHNQGRYRYLWIECPANLDQNLTETTGELEIRDRNQTIVKISYKGVPLPPVDQCKIVKEKIQRGKFQKFDPNRSLYHFIQQNLYWLKKKGSSLPVAQ